MLFKASNALTLAPLFIHSTFVLSRPRSLSTQSRVQLISDLHGHGRARRPVLRLHFGVGRVERSLVDQFVVELHRLPNFHVQLRQLRVFPAAQTRRYKHFDIV